jgi:hypothetical protein
VLIVVILSVNSLIVVMLSDKMVSAVMLVLLA